MKVYSRLLLINIAFCLTNCVECNKTALPEVYPPDVISGRLLCYTCMSENVPKISKDIMKFTMNLPEYAQTSSCNDPFTLLSTDIRSQNLWVEECQTECVKIVSENRYLKFVIRGCLEKIFDSQLSLSSKLDKDYDESCDLQKSNSIGAGDTFNGVCLCSHSFCNGGRPTFITNNVSLLNIFVILLLLIFIL